MSPKDANVPMVESEESTGLALVIERLALNPSVDVSAIVWSALHHARALEHHDAEIPTGDLKNDQEPQPLCLWCSRTYRESDHEPFCSAFCAIAAELDSEDR